MVLLNGDEPRGGELRIELAPNCALTTQAARRFLLGIAVITFAIALFFTAKGLWPILPFAGLEIALLGWALRASLRRGEEREFIVVSDDSVVVEQVGRKGLSRTVFPRHWARVKLCGPSRAPHPSRLLIESHGRGCEVGRFLTEDERRGLAAQLRRLVGKMSESPALAP
jgi:uncharacterized membrane protein